MLKQLQLPDDKSSYVKMMVNNTSYVVKGYNLN